MPGWSGYFLSSGSRILNRLLEIGHGLVVKRLVQGERVEDLRLDVVRILLNERFHRLFVVLRARVLVDLVVVLVELLDRRQPVAFTLRLGADRLALLDRLQTTLQRRRIEGPDERVRADAHRQTPVGDGAARVGLRDRRERLDRLGEEEGMERRERALELLLRLRRARSLEQHATELLGARTRRGRDLGSPCGGGE